MITLYKNDKIKIGYDICKRTKKNCETFGIKAKAICIIKPFPVICI